MADRGALWTAVTSPSHVGLGPSAGRKGKEGGDKGHSPNGEGRVFHTLQLHSPPSSPPENVMTAGVLPPSPSAFAPASAVTALDARVESLEATVAGLVASMEAQREAMSRVNGENRKLREENARLNLRLAAIVREVELAASAPPPVVLQQPPPPPPPAELALTGEEAAAMRAMAQETAALHSLAVLAGTARPSGASRGTISVPSSAASSSRRL
jgi:hypothetical protein